MKTKMKEKKKGIQIKSCEINSQNSIKPLILQQLDQQPPDHK